MSYSDNTARTARFKRAEDKSKQTHSKHGKHPIKTTRERRTDHKGARRQAAMRTHEAVQFLDVDELDIAPAYRQSPGTTAVLTR